MPAPKNRFKERLKQGETQIGLWLGLGGLSTDAPTGPAPQESPAP